MSCPRGRRRGSASRLALVCRLTTLALAGVIVLPMFGSPASAQVSRCVGDCSSDRQVTINELLTMVNIALGNELVVDCLAGDANADGQITVNDIIAAVNSGLKDCAPTPTPLAGMDASAAAARVPISTMHSIQILDFGFVAAQPAHAAAQQFRLSGRERVAIVPRGASGRGAAASTPPDTQCDSGTATVTPCSVTDESGTLSVTYNDCHIGTPSGHTIVRNGTVTQTVASPTFCDTLSIPSDAAVTLQLRDFTLTESDSASTVLAQISATITDHLTPTGGGCSAADGDPLINSTEVIDGAQTVACEPAAESLACPAPNTNLALTVNALTLQRTASVSGLAGTCQLAIIARGNLGVDNRALGEGVALTFDQTRLSEPLDGNGSAGFAIDGLLHADCLGDATFHTSQPILMRPGTKCPADGAFEVSVANTESASPAAAGGTLPAMVHFAQALGLGATHTNSVIDDEGFRQTIFRATDGTVYQILQNVNANADLGAEDFQVTTLVGSQVDAEGCSGPAGGAFDASAVVAALFGPAFDPGRVTKSSRITDVSPPCLDPESNDGAGSVCIGPDCTSACTCPDGGNCTAFTLAAGASATTATDIPAASLVSLTAPEKACSGFAGGMTYAFGAEGPTIEAGLCAPVPVDGFALPNGTSLVFAYHVPLGTSFFLGSAGFPIDRDGQNPFKCPANTVLATGRASPDLIPPPSVQYTASGGVDFDFNRDGLIDQSVSTCEDPALILCGPVPIATPLPNPICPLAENDLGNAASVTRSGTTAGQPNALGGASCGRGGSEAPEVAFAYTAPTTGFYTIDTIDSGFDTLLYVRDGSCSGEELACNDDITAGTDMRSQVGLFLNGGQRIVIVVDGFGTASGPFTLHVNLTSAVAPTPTPIPTPAPQTGLPDLVITQLTGPTTAMPGDAVTVSVTVVNQGTADAGGFQVGFVVSLDTTISADDISTGFSCSFAGLAAGDSTTCTTSIVVPPTLLPGTYFLGAAADFTDYVIESNEANNSHAADTGPLVLNGPFWESHGPDGGPVSALAIDPSTPATLYAGTLGGGVFKSTDGGAHWTAKNVGLSDLGADVIVALVIDPLTPATLYAGTFGGGVFKSTDGGAHWAALSVGLPKGIFGVVALALAIDPSTPATLYAAFGGVFKSTDGGAHWAAISVGLPDTVIVQALAIDPATPATLYAGTFNGGVFKSADGGAHWAATNLGLSNTDEISALAIDPSTPATLYAGTSGGSGVFKSTDGGADWGAMSLGLSNTDVRALAIDPATPATLYAGTSGDGVFKSTDGGAHWAATPNAELILALAIDPVTPATLYAGTFNGGVFKSTDGGAHWAAMNLGLSNKEVSALAIDRVTPATLYAVTEKSGVFKSTDGGAHWAEMNVGLSDAHVQAVAIDPATPATLYVGTRRGVFKSTDGSATWRVMSSGLSSTDVFAIAVDPLNPTKVYAGTDGGGVFVLQPAPAQ